MRSVIILFVVSSFTLAGCASDHEKNSHVPGPSISKEARLLDRVPAPSLKPLLKCPPGRAETCEIYEVCDARGCTKETRCFCLPIEN